MEYHPVNLLSGMCILLGECTDDYAYERRPDCPLTFVPEPHGRLTDLDRLKEVFRRNVLAADTFDAIFESAPVIVEGSEE